MANSDYISREAVLRDWPQCDEPGDAYQFIRHFPAADVRPVVKSKWADNHVSFYRGCPECGAFVRANLDEVFLRDFPSAVGKLNFCPNCGADMRGESDV